MQQSHGWTDTFLSETSGSVAWKQSNIMLFSGTSQSPRILQSARLKAATQWMSLEPGRQRSSTQPRINGAIVAKPKSLLLYSRNQRVWMCFLVNPLTSEQRAFNRCLKDGASSYLFPLQGNLSGCHSSRGSCQTSDPAASRPALLD